MLGRLQKIIQRVNAQSSFFLTFLQQGVEYSVFTNFPSLSASTPNLV